MVTIFYYMFFQTQHHEASIIKEQLIRTQLEYTNRIDGSTGVLNKNAFTDAVKTLLQPQNIRNHNCIGFIFLDLDHLKELNDTHGHSVGDIAILDAVDTIREIFRKSDLIGRFGGDGFYILLPDITRQRRQTCLQEMQEGLRREYTAEGTSITVTASLGAVYTEKLEDLTYEKLVHTADEALYEAKATGRNRHILKEL